MLLKSLPVFIFSHCRRFFLWHARGADKRLQRKTFTRLLPPSHNPTHSILHPHTYPSLRTCGCLFISLHSPFSSCLHNQLVFSFISHSYHKIHIMSFTRLLQPARSLRSMPALLARSAVPRFVVSPAVSAFHTSAKRLQASTQTVITPSSGNAYMSKYSRPNIKNKKDRLCEVQSHLSDLGHMVEIADMTLLSACLQNVPR